MIFLFVWKRKTPRLLARNFVRRMCLKLVKFYALI
uniref:Uncharacterized protein n=1 Tax=Arundo donax TaxID=35708 RepID=A0A0A9AJJ8_ARUDO